MAIPDARVMAYTNLFKSKMGGGAMAVYQGMPRYQSGKGFGDSSEVSSAASPRSPSTSANRHSPRCVMLRSRRHHSQTLSSQQCARQQRHQTMERSVRSTKLSSGVDASGVGSTRQYIRVTKPSDRKRLSTTFRETHTPHPTHHQHQTSTWRQWGRS